KPWPAGNWPVMARCRKLLFLLWPSSGWRLVLLVSLSVGVVVGGRHLWAYCHYRTAQQALGQRKFAQARLHLRQCLKVWSNNAEVHWQAARAARRSGDYEEAALHLNRCEELFGKPERITLERALLRAQRGEVTAVERYLLSQVDTPSAETALLLEALIQ